MSETKSIDDILNEQFAAAKRKGIIIDVDDIQEGKWDGSRKRRRVGTSATTTRDQHRLNKEERKERKRKERRQKEAQQMVELSQKMSVMKWEEWKSLGGNPFNTVITKKNCAQLGIPDYFTREDTLGNKVVKEAMNLEWVKLKAQGKGKGKNRGPYNSFGEMDRDIIIIYDNAVKYNQEGEPVHRMAKEMFAEYRRLRKNIHAEALASKSKRKQDRAIRRQAVICAGSMEC